MSPQDDITTPGVSGHETDNEVSDPDTKALFKAVPSNPKDPLEGEIKLPSVEQILSELTAETPSLPTRGTETVQLEEQANMFCSLRSLLKKAEEEDEGKCFDLRELHAALDQADADSRRGRRDLKALESVLVILHRLWECQSDYMAQAAEILADGSRDPSWRVPYGRAGILDFFLRLIATKEGVDTSILLHSLRLVGNSCADTDENREIIVKDNYTLAIIQHFLNPDLIHVAIPVVYNICTDFEPAQSQAAANRIAYILLKLVKDGAVNGNGALLNFSYELIEMASQQEKGIEQSPDGTVQLIVELAIENEVDFAQFSCLVNCLVAYLENKRLQDVCISQNLVEGPVSVLKQSFSIDVGPSTADLQAMEQLRLKINQSLAEVSGSPLFMEHYSLDSPLSQTLVSWLQGSEEQLQICSCVMLGNLARTDEVCQAMVRDLNIHRHLISILRSDARGAVLHSVLGFLKNLAIAADNRSYLGDAGIIPAVSRLWKFEMLPQVQFSAASTARQVITSSIKNVSRLLDPLSTDPDSPAHMRTYLSLLLSLFEKTDSTPIKIDIGRTIASICRTLSPRARESSALFERLFSLHEDVARPIGSMITQTQWPVVRSEGWFALALMASSKPGSLAVVDCLQDTDMYQLLEGTLVAEISDSTDETDRLRITKDRDNAIILVKELLKNASDALSPTWSVMLEDFVNNHVSQRLRSTEERA